MVVYYNSVLPCNARRRVTSSIYSRSPPTGTPLAIRVTLIPVGLISLLIYMAVVSPSKLEFVAIITSSTSCSRRTMSSFKRISFGGIQASGNSTVQHMIDSIVFSGLFIRNQITGILHYHNRLVISGSITADRTDFLICQVKTALTVFYVFLCRNNRRGQCIHVPCGIFKI